MILLIHDIQISSIIQWNTGRSIKLIGHLLLDRCHPSALLHLLHFSSIASLGDSYDQQRTLNPSNQQKYHLDHTTVRNCFLDHDRQPPPYLLSHLSSISPRDDSANPRHRQTDQYRRRSVEDSPTDWEQSLGHCHQRQPRLLFYLVVRIDELPLSPNQKRTAILYYPLPSHRRWCLR